MAASLVIDIPAPIDVRIVRARVDAVTGWAVKWGHPRRRFRQALWFPTREQADRLVARLRADDHGRDAQRLLTKAIERPLTTTAAERGRLGGPARARALSPERRRDIALKANAARWAQSEPTLSQRIDAVNRQIKDQIAALDQSSANLQHARNKISKQIEGKQS